MTDSHGRELPGGNIGRYRVVDFVGAGGMGLVYRAIDPGTGQIVALKTLAATTSSTSLSERLRREARILADIRHPNVARLHDVFEFEARPCLAMEFVDGRTVAEQLAVGGRFPPAEALHVTRKLADALGHLHARDVLHRDVKAENVKITSDGEIKLLDFGIARYDTDARMTVAEGAIGTLPYMAPELLETGVHSARTEVWALGILLYEMVAGAPPFSAATPIELRRLQQSPPPAPSSIVPGAPLSLDRVVASCLEVKPNRRLRDGQAVADALSADAVPGQPRNRIGFVEASAALFALGALASAAWFVSPFEAEPSNAETFVSAPRELANAPFEPAAPQATELSRPAVSPGFRCTTDRPPERPGQAIVFFSNQGPAVSLLLQRVRIGSTPCFIQRPQGSRHAIALRSASGVEQTRLVDFNTNGSYTLMLQ